jgi:hypothetical protein
MRCILTRRVLFAPIKSFVETVGSDFPGHGCFLSLVIPGAVIGFLLYLLSGTSAFSLLTMKAVRPRPSTSLERWFSRRRLKNMSTRRWSLSVRGKRMTSAAKTRNGGSSGYDTAQHTNRLHSILSAYMRPSLWPFSSPAVPLCVLWPHAPTPRSAPSRSLDG